MIRECNVIKKNEFVTVVRFNDIDIQLPAISGDLHKVFISYENGKYSIVDKQDASKEKPVRTTDKKVDKSTRKKTTPILYVNDME